MGKFDECGQGSVGNVLHLEYQVEGYARHQGLACYLGTLCCGYDFDTSFLYITDANNMGEGV
jgi:hypothetical protein